MKKILLLVIGMSLGVFLTLIQLPSNTTSNLTPRKPLGVLSSQQLGLAPVNSTTLESPKIETTVETQQPPVTAVETSITSTSAEVPITVAPKEQLMQAAGIAESDWTYVDYIISHESSWNVNATNASSGAHGLPQALPYSKTGCEWSDGVCQLQWASTYATSRYGSWYGAYQHWISARWW